MLESNWSDRAVQLIAKYAFGYWFVWKVFARHISQMNEKWRKTSRERERSSDAVEVSGAHKIWFVRMAIFFFWGIVSRPGVGCDVQWHYKSWFRKMTVALFGNKLKMKKNDEVINGSGSLWSLKYCIDFERFFILVPWLLLFVPFLWDPIGDELKWIQTKTAKLPF